MLEKPDFPDEKIIACLRDRFDLPTSQLEFLPLGADINTAVYRVVAANGIEYFLKLRSGNFDENSVIVPRLLVDYGVKQIINPISNNAESLWTPLESYTAVLYPFVVGDNGSKIPFTVQQWIDFGAALHRIHDMPVSELQDRLQAENWSGQWRDAVRTFMTRAMNEPFQEPVAAKLAALLNKKRPIITDLIARAERHCETLQSNPPVFVLCHSDIHQWNVLITPRGDFYIVDWDNPILAPKERDLMFIGGGMGEIWNNLENIALFYQGYGQGEINPTALAYYRYERIIQDIAAYCEQLLLTDEGGADREQSFQQLTGQFAPDDVIAAAYCTENVQPPPGQLL